MLRLFAIAAAVVSGQDMTPSFQCPYTYGTKCVDTCPPNTLFYGTVCVDSCPAPLMAMPPYCVLPTPDQLCDSHIPGSLADLTTGKCVCPQGQWLVRDWNVTDRLGSRCAPSSVSSLIGTRIGCATFIRNTTYVPPPMDTCQCVRELPVIVSNPVDKFLPFACAPIGTVSQIPPCPSNMYFDFMTGQCVVPSQYPSLSASQTLKSATSSASGGRILPSTVSATISAVRPMEPSVTQTQTFKDTMLADVTVSAEPTKRPMEPSASQTIKDTMLTDVTVSAEPTKRPMEPSASQTQTIKDTMLADVTVSVEPTKRPMEPADTVTKTAEITMRPTIPMATAPYTPRPTIPIASAPFTPRPTILMASVRPKPTAELVWSTGVDRTPLPSFESTKMPLVRMTVMPPPLRPARNITIAPEDRPPYIASQIKFPGANMSAFQKPETFQELQMSLACTLRVALENIRITNITIMDSRMPPVIIDATRFLLSSNGTAGCFKIERNTTSTHTPAMSVEPRRLQAAAAATSQVQVDYYIVEPPTEILSLTPSEFSSVIESSPVMVDLSASVGSTGIQAITEASIMATTASSNSASPNNSVLIGGVVGGVALALAIIVAGVVGFQQMRKRSARVATLSRSSSVHVLHINPAPGNQRLSVQLSSQNWMYGSNQRNPVAFEAKKTRSSI